MTEGPWEITEQNGTFPGEGFVGVRGPKYTTKAGKDIYFYVAQFIKLEDAPLISAAPDLLKAAQVALDRLQEIREHEYHGHEPDPMPSDEEERLMEAIKKATNHE